MYMSISSASSLVTVAILKDFVLAHPTKQPSSYSKWIAHVTDIRGQDRSIKYITYSSKSVQEQQIHRENAP